MSPEIRPIQPNDQEAWIDLRHALYGDQRQVHVEEVAAFLDGTASEPRAVLVAADGAQLLGLAEIEVDQAHRRQGVGKRLLRAVLDRAAAEGAETIARTQRSNAAAIALHAEPGGAPQDYDDQLFGFRPRRTEPP